MILVGSPWVIRKTILSLHKLNYAEPNDWSPLQPTDQPGKMMAILTKKMVREEGEFWILNSKFWVLNYEGWRWEINLMMVRMGYFENSISCESLVL